LASLETLGEFLDSAGYDARLFLSLEKCLASVEIKAAGCFITGQVNAVGIKAPCILLAERNEIDTMAFCSTGDARFLFSKPIVGPELLAAVALITGCPAVVQRIGFAEIVACVTGLMKRISLLTLIGRLLGVGARKRSRGPDCGGRVPQFGCLPGIIALVGRMRRRFTRFPAAVERLGEEKLNGVIDGRYSPPAIPLAIATNRFVDLERGSMRRSSVSLCMLPVHNFSQKAQNRS
jgi:hypothetical protein